MGLRIGDDLAVLDLGRWLGRAREELADQIWPAEQDDPGEHDREDHVAIVFHESANSLSVTARDRARSRPKGGT